MKKDKLIYSFLMALSMSLFMTGLITLFNIDYIDDGYQQWAKAFLIAFPCAFILLIILNPFISRLTNIVVRLF